MHTTDLIAHRTIVAGSVGISAERRCAVFEIVAAVVGVALMAAFVAGSLRYFRRIRTGRADPVVNPAWPDIMRPASPHRLSPPQRSHHQDRP